MVIVDERLLGEIMNDPNFVTQTHHLANTLEYDSDAKAGHDLVYHFLNVRCKDMSYDDFKKSWYDRSPYQKGVVNRKYLKWLMTFSVKDLVKKHVEDINSNSELKQYLQQHVPTASEMHDKSKSSNTNKDRIRELCLMHLQHIFPRSPQKRKIAEIILTKGQKEAEIYIQSKSKTRLNRWLQIIDEYCSNRRTEINKILGRELSNRDKKKLEFITTFLIIEDDDELTLFTKQGMQAELIDRNKKLFEELIGTCGDGESRYISHQVALLAHWERVEYQTEKDALVEYLRGQKEHLENKLT